MSTPYENIAFAAELNEELPQVDLHGQSKHLAIHELDQALHHAFMVGAEAIRIIHGRGSGALRQTIHDHLRRQAQIVAYFQDATSPGQVGGMTIAVLHGRSGQMI